MGVMSCHRRGCENIMCDTYVDAVGYVCYECQKEFENFLAGKIIKTEGKMIEKLEKFMKDTKTYYHKEEEKGLSVSEFFNNYSRD